MKEKITRRKGQKCLMNNLEEIERKQEFVKNKKTMAIYD